MPMPRMTRRQFLRFGAAAGAGTLLAPGMLGGCPFSTAPAREVPLAPTTRPATVAATRGRDLYAMTHRVLQSLGGISTIVQPGETVFIKPNLLTAGLGRENPTATGEIAKPEIVVAAAEACLQAGAARVIIGDGAQVVAFDWSELKTLDGATHMAAEAVRLNALYDDRVTLACLNSDSPQWATVAARRTDLGQIYVSSLVAHADHIISIPVLKTHRDARLTLSLKNLIGTTPISHYGGGSEYRGRSRLHLAAGGPEACYLDLFEGLRPDLAIIDASVCCEDYGPWVRPREGRTVDMRERLGDWLLLAGTDLVAADATAARIVGHNPDAISYLRHAHEQGLGQTQADLITLDGPALDDLRVEWDPA